MLTDQDQPTGETTEEVIDGDENAGGDEVKTDTPPGDTDNKDTKVDDADAGGDQPDVPEAYRGEDGKPDMAKLLERVTKADEADAAKAEGVPESADAYELKVSDDIKMPDGTPVELDADNPLIKEFLTNAHEAGWSQDTVSKNLNLFAREMSNVVSGIEAAQKQAVEAEIAKVDEDRKAVEARFTAVENDLSEMVGKDGASALLKDVRTADAFLALESLREKLLESGARGGDAPGGKRTLAQSIYNKM